MRRAVCAIALLVLAGAALADTIAPSDDAYHLRNWSGTPALSAYTEWWYFNVVDTTQNLQAVLVYYIANPDQLGTGGSAANMVAIVYTPGAVTPEADPYPVTSFHASYSAANVTLGGNSIHVAGANTYVLTGASLDGAVSWNLTFTRQATSFQGFNAAELGAAPWEKMSWLVYMPRAAVSGQLTANGVTYIVNGSGYHDHNWGEWLPKDVLWNWAQYSQSGFWFDIYDFINESNGLAQVSVNGTTFAFSKSQYQLVNSQWIYDPQHHLSYPTQTTVTADNGSQQLQVVMNVTQTAPLTYGFTAASQSTIYEQAVTYSGAVTANSITLPFSGRGFKEYTAAHTTSNSNLNP